MAEKASKTHENRVKRLQKEARDRHKAQFSVSSTVYVFINENGRLPMLDYRNLRLERYELRERIGAGGMARVFKAWDTVLERPVAVKILHDHLADDPNFKERFEREARLIASLSHPNIVQIYDFKALERDDLPLYYMVMPLIAG